MTNGCHDRILYFEGAKNVRDLGGLPTARGKTTRYRAIYRGDGLSRLTEADLERLNALKLNTIIDLRYDEERERAPDRLPTLKRPTLFHRGFLPEGTFELFDSVNNQGAGADQVFELMRLNYSRMPFGHVGEFRDVMHYLIEPERAPHFIHCTSGKDRTGIIVAFILRAVGVGVDHVVADYEMSNVDHQAVDMFGPNAHLDAIAVIMAARAEYLLAAFEAIDAHSGNFEHYLRNELKFGKPEQTALAALLLT
jgi:protein-tyrosine phosphatase